jgi:hypothetical protein
VPCKFEIRSVKLDLVALITLSGSAAQANMDSAVTA